MIDYWNRLKIEDFFEVYKAGFCKSRLCKELKSDIYNKAQKI